MTAGAQVVCDAVARKVEVDCLNASDALFSGGVEVSAHDPGDIVGDLAGEVDQFKKEGIPVDPLVLESNGSVRQSTVSDAEVKNVEAEKDGIGSGLTFVPKLTPLNTVESSQVTVSELESAVKPREVMVNGGLESFSNLIDKVECEGQAMEDGSGKPSQDLGSEVTADGKKSCGSPIKEGECEVTVNGSDSIGSSVDGSEPSVDHTVMELNGKPEEHHELLVITSEVEPKHSSYGLVLSVETDAMANGQVVYSDRILETQILGTEADGSLEKQLKVTESVELEANSEEMKGQVKVVDQKVEIVSADDDDEKETEDKDAEDAPHLVTEIRSVQDIKDEEKETEVKDAHAEFVHDTVPENGSAGVMDCETEVKDAPVGDHSTSFSGPIMNNGAVIKFGSFGLHESIPSTQTEELEDQNGFQSDAIDVHSEEVEVLEYNFLVKIPRFEDEALKDQIRSAHELVEQKTRLRDSLRAAVLKNRDKLQALNVAYNAAKKEETVTRRLIRNKRQEIEDVQAIINRWKNAMTVQDIDLRIHGVERMIQHETLELADEKQLIREVRQLKSLRDELALGMGTAEEIRHAIDTKDRNEERVKVLRKELDALKATVANAVAVQETIKKEYNEGNGNEYELQDQFRAADDDRQRAYAHLNSLKKLSYDKNNNYRQFKQDLSSARKFLKNGDTDALHSLCANQVETFMEQWNNDDEFRKEYISRCNMIASRRQKAQDAAPPVSDNMPSNVTEKHDTIPVEVKPVEKGKDVSCSCSHSHSCSSTEGKKTGKSIEHVTGEKELKTKGVVKPTGSDDVAKEEDEVAVVAEVAVEEKVLTKEEIEMARKAEEEIAAKLKEQRRLEEKAKAMEALERKKRNAEKAQLRAELRARKEAEQKEKEREKRLRKKEKKTGGGDGSINGEEAANSESSNEAKETETVTKKKTQKPPAHFFSKQLKSKPVPAVLINKNKKHWQQYVNIALVLIALGFMGFMINCGLFSDFKPRRFNNPF